MTDDVVAAIAILQERCRREGDRSPYWNERIERALDDLVRNPNRTGNPHHLVRNALSNAGQMLDRRRQLCSIQFVGTPADLEVYLDLDHRGMLDGRRRLHTARPGSWDDAADHHRIAVASWLAHAPLTRKDRRLLQLLAHGTEADEIAAHDNAPVHRVRVQVSRARQRASALLAVGP
jgi:DNA-binding CsgD family transcriptional regulator